MIDIETQEHWRFAYLSAIIRLDFLIWEFDFQKEVRHHSYIGFPSPSKLIDIVDGLLHDIEDLPQGDINRLLEIRQRLNDKLLVAYNVGEDQAHKVWTDASEPTRNKYMEYDVTTIRNKGLSLADLQWSLAEQSWFLEAFCKTWMYEWGEQIRRNMEKE